MHPFSKIIPAVVIGLSLSFAPAAAYDDPNENVRGMRDRFTLNAGGFFPSFDTQVRLDSTNLVGTIIRLESNLNLDEETDNFRIDGHWRFTQRSRIEFSAFNIRRGSELVLDEEIVIPDDTTYLVGAKVATEFNTAFLKAAYKWSFFNNGKVDTGFSVGLSILDATFELEAIGDITDDMGNPVVIGDGVVEEGFTFPVTVAGQFLSLTLRKRCFYGAGFDLFAFDAGDWKGSIIDVKMSLDYYFTRNFGIGLGYNYITIDYDEQDGSPRIDVEYEFQGAMGYLTFAF
jgi:hypothetical protein